jgi:outer membrane protein assembly factor BamB
MVYIGSLDGNLYALDSGNGNIIWKAKANGPLESSPAVSDGAVYFNSEEPNEAAIYKVDAATGALIWKQQFPYLYSPIEAASDTEMLGSPSVAAGMVFTSTDLRTYYALNAATGNILWNFSNPAANEFIVSSPIYVNGDLYILDKYNIDCLDAVNTHVFWSAYTGDELYTSLSYAGGFVYVVTSQRHIFVLNTARNGTTIAMATTPSSSWSSPTIANGMLYVGCNDWNMYCYANSPAIQAPHLTPTPSQNLMLKPSSMTIIAIVAAIAVILTIVTVTYAVRNHAKKKASLQQNPTYNGTQE